MESDMLINMGGMLGIERYKEISMGGILGMDSCRVKALDVCLEWRVISYIKHGRYFWNGENMCDIFGMESYVVNPCKMHIRLSVFYNSHLQWLVESK